MKILKNNQGGVLLLALMIMAGIITISAATGSLILNELKQSSQLDRAMTAFYAADSGVERGLYLLKKQDFSVEQLGLTESILPNSSYYHLYAENGEKVYYKTLAQDEAWQLDLYQPGNLSPLTPAIKSLRFNWTGAVGSWLEVRYIPWSSDGVFNPNPELYWQDRGKTVKLSLGEVPYVLNLINNSNYLYVVRLTARTAAINSLEVTAYDRINPGSSPECAPLGPSSQCAVTIPGQVQIKSVGEYPFNLSDASKQAIEVTLPLKDPLSGMFDYVLFSEEEISKEN